MKAIKAILIIAAVLFAAFFALGVFKPTIDYGATVEVSKSPEVAWAVYMDSSLMSEWVPTAKSITLVSGEHGQPSSYEIMMDYEGEMVSTMEELIALQENESITFRFYNEMMSIDNTVTFTPKEDGGTTITSESVAHGEGFFWKSMFAMIGDGFNKKEAIHYKALAELIERTDVEFEMPEMEMAIDSLAIDSTVVDSL